jgi:MFS family permease
VLRSGYLRSLFPPLPREIWLLQATGLAVFGTGVAIPFLVIYLHDVRGISLGLAGLVAASNGLCALVAGPVAGALADRIGARPTLLVSLVVLAAAFAMFPLIRQPWHAFLLNGLAGVGSGGFWPSHATLLSALTPPKHLAAAFAQRNITANLGIGLGGLVGGLIARTGDPSTFTTLFGLASGVFLLFAAIVSRLPSGKQADVSETTPDLEGYRAVARDRPYVWFIALNTLLISATIGLTGIFPAFAKNEAGVSERELGIVFFVNTLLIVLLQLPVTRHQAGRRRMVAFAAMAGLWACTWLLVLAGGLWLEAASAAVLFAFAIGVVGALGECLHGSVQGPLVTDLAPRRLLGRYMAVSTSSWELGFVIGPAVGGILLQVEPYALWPVAAGGCALVAIGSLLLERRLPPAVLRTPAG